MSAARGSTTAVIDAAGSGAVSANRPGDPPGQRHRLFLPDPVAVWCRINRAAVRGV